MVGVQGSAVEVDYPERIRRLRYRLGLSQGQLAELLAVSRATINRWEQGHSQPSSLAWQQIARMESTGADASTGHGLAAPDAPPSPFGVGTGPAAPTADVLVRQGGFVGRTREFGTLLHLLETARQGGGGVALVAGEPGIGKTRLVEELAAVARRAGVQVMWGRGYEGAGAPAFWPWMQVLRACLRDREAAALRAAISTGALEIAQLLPEVAVLVPELPEPPPLTSEHARFRLFDSITSFLKRIAAGGVQGPMPLLIVLDDLHWADVPSLLLIEFLAGELAEAHVLVVGTYRDLEVRSGDGLARAFADLARSPRVTRVALAGMSAPEVQQVIEGAIGRPPSAELLTTVTGETEGNPLFVIEMVRLLMAAGADGARPRLPASVQDVIGRRLERLSEECFQVLSVAAVIGREFSVEVLMGAGDLAADPLLTLLEEAEAAWVIEPLPDLPGRYRFTHPLIRQTLYERIGASRRVRLHRQVGMALERTYGAGVELHLVDLAWHFAQAAPLGESERAIRYAEQAAEWATHLSAHEEAVRHLELALSLTIDTSQRADLLLRLGEAQVRAGDARARETFREAAILARRLRTRPEGADVGVMLARAALGVGASLHVTARDDLHVSLLEEALRTLDEEDSALRARVLGDLARALFSSPEPERRERLGQAAVAMARRIGDPELLATTLFDRYFGLWGPANLPERIEAATELARLAEEHGDKERALEAYRLRVPTLLELGDVRGLDAAIDAHRRLAEELRHPGHRWWSAAWCASRALLAGRFTVAAEQAGQALAIGQKARIGDALVIFQGQQGGIAWEVGQFDDLVGRVQEIERMLEQHPGIPSARALLIAAYHELGREGDAWRAYQSLYLELTGAGGDSGRLPRHGDWLMGVGALAVACAALGDSNGAAALYELLVPYAGGVIMPGGAILWLGTVSRRLGLLAATMRRWEVAVRHFEDDVALCTRLGARTWLARVQHDYAVMLLARHGSERGTAAPRASAGEPDLDRALALVDQCLMSVRELGMAHLAQQAEDTRWAVLEAAETAAVPVVGLPDGLTAREVEVLRLLASGRSNQEIAAALVLSVRTVERHIQTVYGKIGAGGRAARASATAYAIHHNLIRA